MDYQEIGRTLSVEFESRDMDLLQLGILSSSLHSILNYVAIALYDEANHEAEEHGKPKVLDHIPQNLNRDDVLVRARVINVRYGSVIYDIQPVIAAIFSQPGAIVIAQNLVANALWAIAAYGTRITGARIASKSPLLGGDQSIPATTARKRIRPQVHRLVEQLKQSGNGGKITFRSGDEELNVEFYPPDEPPSQGMHPTAQEPGGR